MRRLIALSVILFLALPSPRASASELMFSRDYTPNGGASPAFAANGVQFVIEFESQVVPGQFKLFGCQAYWQDGEVGTYEFSEDNSLDFVDFVQLVTNGIDDEIALMTWNAPYGGSGHLATESEWGFGDPDLSGHEIDFIRLVVHDLSLQTYIDPSYGCEGLKWFGHVTWEFWGEPIPEPTTAMLLCTAALICCRKSPRRAQAPNSSPIGVSH